MFLSILTSHPFSDCVINLSSSTGTFFVWILPFKAVFLPDLPIVAFGKLFAKAVSSLGDFLPSHAFTREDRFVRCFCVCLFLNFLGCHSSDWVLPNGSIGLSIPLLLTMQTQCPPPPPPSHMHFPVGGLHTGNLVPVPHHACGLAAWTAAMLGLETNPSPRHLFQIPSRQSDVHASSLLWFSDT